MFSTATILKVLNHTNLKLLAKDFFTTFSLSLNNAYLNSNHFFILKIKARNSIVFTCRFDYNSAVHNSQ